MAGAAVARRGAEKARKTQIRARIAHVSSEYRRVLTFDACELCIADWAVGAIGIPFEFMDLDTGATEQVFGHLKDEFFHGQDWQTFESFKADLDAYITHWNTTRRQVKLKGLTPAEYRDQALQEAA